VRRDTRFDDPTAGNELGIDPLPFRQTIADTVRWLVESGRVPALRHAGQAATSVIIRWGEQLVITVSDNGCRANNGGAPGRGLLGLRERLSLYGGKLDAGPRPGGGWQVRAVMPTGLAA
jgi:glucose-6-phosphate-specific signal transduction histidine kinase